MEKKYTQFKKIIITAALTLCCSKPLSAHSLIAQWKQELTEQAYLLKKTDTNKSEKQKQTALIMHYTHDFICGPEVIKQETKPEFLNNQLIKTIKKINPYSIFGQLYIGTLFTNQPSPTSIKNFSTLVNIFSKYPMLSIMSAETLNIITEILRDIFSGKQVKGLLKNHQDHLNKTTPSSTSWEMTKMIGLNLVTSALGSHATDMIGNYLDPLLSFTNTYSWYNPYGYLSCGLSWGTWLALKAAHLGFSPMATFSRMSTQGGKIWNTTNKAINDNNQFRKTLLQLQLIISTLQDTLENASDIIDDKKDKKVIDTLAKELDQFTLPKVITAEHINEIRNGLKKVGYIDAAITAARHHTAKTALPIEFIDKKDEGALKKALNAMWNILIDKQQAIDFSYAPYYKDLCLAIHKDDTIKNHTEENVLILGAQLVCAQSLGFIVADETLPELTAPIRLPYIDLASLVIMTNKFYRGSIQTEMLNGMFIPLR